MPENPCPSCGVPLPAHALGGQCPRCLLLEGLDTDATSTGRGSDGDPLGLPARPGSVLETIAATVSHVPRVLLRDTTPGETPGPIVRPDGDDSDPSNRYRIDGEIARGGMGSVLKGRDPDLGRDVAIKVLRADLRDKADLVRRFVEEAQIGGQLQHPGVVPIYELGTFADKRPFFSMKLVKGQTLADRLAARSEPADDLPRFLSIYAAIAQTMAYSHTRGVIHRDLKPSNVMVGSFGEVQVMDWGLAKVLPRGGAAADARAGKEAPDETLIATARSGSDTDLSHAGSVLGTPSYMPPEQARGEIELVDERADVFSMGSILCEILTGSPAFTGRTSAEILRRAARGETADALARLDGCGAEGELIALARDCLAAEPDDRPRDAKVVADRITAYQAGVQERVQAAERERAVAVARAVEERRRRKVQLALAASVLALLTLGGLSTTYYLQQRQAREAAGQRVIDQVATLQKQAVAHPEDIQRWEVALAAVEQADPAGDPNARAQLAALQAQIQAGLDAARRDKTLLDRVVEIRSAEADDPDGSITDHDYADAFRAAGIDLATLPPAEAAAKIRARPAPVVLGLTAALDDWTAIRRMKRNDYQGSQRLRAVALVADPDPWRNELRTRLDGGLVMVALEQNALQVLAREAKYEELGPISLQLLGSALWLVGDSRGAESVLRRAQQLYPGDVWINHELGKVLDSWGRLDEAIRFYTAARAIRPETAHELADALEKRGEIDESIAVHRDLNELRPGNATILGCLGRLFKAKGLSEEASEAFKAAEAAEREAERLRPAVVASAHSKLAMDLAQHRKYEEVITELRTVKRLDPNRRFRWPNPPGSPFWMGGTLDESIAEYYYLLGDSLKDGGPLDRARAIAAYRKAIQLRPELAKCYSALVLALKAQGKLDEVVAAYREAIRLEPGNAVAHLNLGGILRDRGDFAGSLAMLRRGHELGSKQPGWPHPSARWVAEAERRAALAERLVVVLKGESSPKDNAERMDLALLCYDTKRFAAAARFVAEALEADPKFGEDARMYRHGAAHHNATTFAALAALGQGEDDPRPDEATRNRLRTQAREWLRVDLGLCSKIIGTSDRGDVRGLYHLKECSELAGFRDATALSRLPEAERNEWQSLWAEIDALCKIVQVITWHNLGNEVLSQRGLDEAIAGFRNAIRLAPDHADSHRRFGDALARKDRPDEAIAEYREAIRLEPRYADGHHGLGNALNRQGKLDEAIAEYREAIRLKPDHAEAHCNLGSALDRQGQKDEAIAECREASRLKPDLDEAHHNLGGLLKSRGDDAGALEMYRKWHELAGKKAVWLHPSARLRSQTLDWLKAERDACSKRMDGGDPNARAQVVQNVKQWKVEINLAAVRDPESLARLPGAERKEWQSLWADVDTLLERAQGHPPKAVAATSRMPAKASEPVPNPTAEAVSTLLGDLRRAGNGPLADRLTQEIQQAQQLLEQDRKRDPRFAGHVIVGRVICEEGDDPSRVVAQMPIHSEGYFVGPVEESGRPVGFRRLGYLPAEIIPSGQPGSVEHVGEVRLRRMTETMGSAVRGKIVLEGESPATPVAARLSLGHGPINTPSNGTQGSFDSFNANVSRSIEFSASGLSPIDYSLEITAPGYITQWRTFRLKPGETHDADPITLERPRSVVISYRVASRPPFTEAGPQRQTVLGGDRFRANPQDPSYFCDLEFPQNNGKLSFRAGYGACAIADLGPGRVEDFLGVAPTSSMFTDANIVPRSGHVYLLDRQQFGNHWVLFQLEFDEKAPRVPGRP